MPLGLGAGRMKQPAPVGEGRREAAERRAPLLWKGELFLVARHGDEQQEEDSDESDSGHGPER